MFEEVISSSLLLGSLSELLVLVPVFPDTNSDNLSSSSLSWEMACHTSPDFCLEFSSPSSLIVHVFQNVLFFFSFLRRRNSG